MNENLIHVKLEINEAVTGKTEVLSVQADMLRLLKTMKKFHKLRTQELTLKLKMHRKVRELIANLRKLQTNLPRIKINDIEIDRYEPAHTRKTIQRKTTSKKDDEERTIDRELADIQAQLKALAG